MSKEPDDVRAEMSDGRDISYDNSVTNIHYTHIHHSLTNESILIEEQWQRLLEIDPE